MAVIQLRQFGGFAPRISPNLLQDNEATKAVNTRLYSGALRPWRQAQSLTPSVNVNVNTKTIYRVRDTAGDDVWFAWTDQVDIAEGPLTDSQAFRFYYTGDGAPKKTNEALAGTTSGGAPADWLSLGVPAPLTAPSVARVGSGASPETRVYTYTYINHFGAIQEESGPAPASAEVQCGTGDSVTVSGFTWSGTYSRTGTLVTVTESLHGLQSGMRVYLDFTSGAAADGWYTVTVTGANTYTVTTAASGTTSGDVTVLVKAPAGQYNITHRRIYRSLSGTGSTTFNFVADVPIATTSYSDSLTSAQIGEVMRSLNWAPPPNDLKGLVRMPNDIMAGFTGREVYFCEPGYPHAWPVEYMVTTEHDIVGLGVYGQSLVVLTKGNPYIISGITSESMSAEKVTIVEPCISARTIASDSEGVTYASPNGFVEIGPNGVQVLTKNIMLKDEFAQFSPLSGVAASTRGIYYMFFESGTYEDINEGALIFDRNVPATPLTVTTLAAKAAYTNKDTGELYVVENGQIKLWDASAQNRLPFEWASKEFILPTPQNFGALELYADFDDVEDAEALQAEIAAITASNQAVFALGGDLQGAMNSNMLNVRPMNGSVLQDVSQAIDDRYILFILYADEEEKFRIRLTARGIYRLPAGFVSDRYKFEVQGNVTLRHLKIGRTVAELKQI
jgi:hypothetical protein